MKLRDREYIADKGKHFVLTAKGEAECASYQSKTIGMPVNEYDTEATSWAVDNGYLIEVDIPDWIEKEGYEVVYDYHGYTIPAGNAIVFPEMELAERCLEHYQSRPWMHHDLYIRKTVFEGRRLKDCQMHENRKVYNKDWYYGVDALRIGDYVEEEIVSDLMDCITPASMRSNCSQLGEPYSHRVDEDGRTRATYVTFKKVTDNIWEYCGDCFRGENTMQGMELPYV